jgi:dCTP deaminase
MMILSAQSIRSWCQHIKPMIDPFHERTVFKGNTFGLSAAGYDVRVEFEIGRMRLLKPGDFFLASTIERFQMPRAVLGIVHDKSSWARRGICVQNTVIEPGWEGYLTLELTNHSTHEIILEAGTSIAQIVFHRLDEATEQPYDGKYQDQQRGPQPAIEETS